MATDTRTPEALVADGLVSVPEACKFLGIGRSLLYEEMDRGELPSVRIGGRRLIPRRALIEYAAKRLTPARNIEAPGR